MAEQKKQDQNNPRQGDTQNTPGQTTDPSQRREGQSGTQRDQTQRDQTQRDQTQRDQTQSGTETGTTTETRNRPEGDVEGI